MLPLLLISVELHGVSSQTGSILTNRKWIPAHSDESSACSTALSMSSGSYSGLAMQELVMRKIKEFIAAPKVSSSGKAEQYGIPIGKKQLRGLPQISVVVRNVL